MKKSQCELQVQQFRIEDLHLEDQFSIGEISDCSAVVVDQDLSEVLANKDKLSHLDVWSSP
jgi:hypothetical protein